jgi:hypothetical protein
MFIGCTCHIVFDLDLCGINPVLLFCKGLCLPGNFKNHTFALHFVCFDLEAKTEYESTDKHVYKMREKSWT